MLKTYIAVIPITSGNFFGVILHKFILKRKNSIILWQVS